MGFSDRLEYLFSQYLLESTCDRYDAYFDRKEAAEILKISKSLAKYVHTKDVRHLVLIDCSARPAYLGFLGAFHGMFPETKAPQIYFVNPEWFNPTRRHQKTINAKFTKTYHRLVEGKEERVLLFDTCVHSGDTLRHIRNTFQGLGFSDLKLGSMQPRDITGLGFRAPPRGYDDVDLNYTSQRRESYSGCYPFGRDAMVKKGMKSVTSIVNRSKTQKDTARRLRMEIADILREAY